MRPPRVGTRPWTIPDDCLGRRNQTDRQARRDDSTPEATPSPTASTKRSQRTRERGGPGNLHRPGGARPQTEIIVLVPDALEQALWARKNRRDLIHHSDRGSQYLSIRYTERLAEGGINASVGTTGDSYDNALAESIIGLYKTEVINHRGPWKGREAVEYATLEWVDWFNNCRLLEPIGNIPPAEKEKEYYQLEESNENSLRRTRGDSMLNFSQGWDFCVQEKEA